MLNLKNKRCVVVGGGPVACRRARALLDAGGEVTVIAPEIQPELSALPIEPHPRTYQTGDLAGACLVVIATGDATANETITRDARDAGVWVNRADAPEAGDFTVPAVGRHGPITLAVDTGGVSASAAAVIRDELSQALDTDWPQLLRLAKPWRAILQSSIPDPAQRLASLKQLCGPRAREILKDRGEAALKTYYEALARGEVRGDAPD